MCKMFDLDPKSNIAVGSSGMNEGRQWPKLFFIQDYYNKIIEKMFKNRKF